MLGLVMMLSSSVRQSGSRRVIVCSPVASVSSPPSIATCRPSSFCSSSSRSAAIRSITFSFSASCAERLAASRTARSAQSALRPRSWARLRMYATASLTILSSIPARRLRPLALGLIAALLLVARRFRAAARRKAAADLDRRRRAQVGAGRHRRHVARIENVSAGARGVRAGRRDEADHRHRGGEDLLDDDAHRIDQTARRVHAQDDQVRALLERLGEAALDVVGGRRPDRPVDLEQGDRGRLAARVPRHEPEAQQGEAEQREPRPAPQAARTTPSSHHMRSMLPVDRLVQEVHPVLEAWNVGFEAGARSIVVGDRVQAADPIDDAVHPGDQDGDEHRPRRPA